MAECTLNLSIGVEWGQAGISPGGLRTFDVEIDYDGVLAASYHHGLAGFVRESVDLLVGHVGRNIDEVTRSGFTAEFQVVAPTHTGPAANDIEDGFQVAMVVWSGLRVRLYYNRASPQFARARSGVCNGCGPCHTESLGRVRVKVAGWNDSDAVMLPVHDLYDSRILVAVSGDRPFSTCSGGRPEA
jgi:hypothetical protein